MEDKTDILRVSPTDIYFGLYDGHGGTACVDYLTHDHRLLNMIKSFVNAGESNPYETAFLNIDAAFKAAKAPRDESGSTATVAHIYEKDRNRYLNIAWVGDSRAVLGNRDGSVAFVTRDHHPTLEDEEKRISAAGGNVEWSLSRAFGDFFLKDAGLIVTPELYDTTLLPETAVLILASDGLWEVMSNEEAIAIALMHLRSTKSVATCAEHPADVYEEYGDSKEMCAARALRDTAFNRRSSDNIGVIVVDLSRIA